MPDYCFALGCARSGTTALARLLHAHPSIVMGMERYKYLLNDAPDSFGPDLFEAQRFLDFRPGDTNITPEIERFQVHYETAARRFARGDVELVGDKLMARQRTANLINDRFDKPTVVFIYRDLFRVASSFCVRARDEADKNWPESGTHELALDRWNEAFAAMNTLEAATDNVFVVRYEHLFNGDARTCRAMFRFLGLDVTPEVSKHFSAATARWEQHEVKQLALTDEQFAFLEDRIDRDLLARFDEQSNHLIEQYASG